jgi:hypothetical protein
VYEVAGHFCEPRDWQSATNRWSGEGVRTSPCRLYGKLSIRSKTSRWRSLRNPTFAKVLAREQA